MQPVVLSTQSHRSWLLNTLLGMSLTLFLAACGGGGSETTTPPPPPPPDKSISQMQAARFLTQATFGADEASINQLAALGYDDWLQQQFTLPPSLHLPLVMEYPDDNTLDQTMRYEVWWRQAITANDQLRQRVAWALSQIFVISDKSALNQTPYGIANYYDILVANAFGNYRDLMQQVTLSPMMGVYLSMLGNEKPNIALNIRPDENYARELMQLFTIGLVKLNIDGSPQLDNNGQPTNTYDQDTIKGFAHVFTGWHFADNPSWYQVRINVFDPMKAFEDFHDTSEKRLLDGFIIPAGGSALSDLNSALDNVFNHPNVGPFVAHRLVQQLVTSNPSPAYVQRVATVFNNNGQGVRGDLKAVIKAILTDNEAISTNTLTDPTFGKLKEPLLRFTQLWRAFHATAESGKYWFGFSEYFTGQAPLSAPHVFNFYSPSYSPSGPIADAGLVAPEFEILNETFITHTLNWLAYSTYIGYQGIPLDPPDPDRILINIDQELILAANPVALVDRYNLLLLSGQMDTNMKAELVASIEAIPASEPLLRVLNSLFLTVASPQYSIQK
ncbi:MAG: DUF1800 domain-containing protein [Enterobacterales bacterium]|nr:DUF1800 domain-containing protein [Enterobacterales bacterium]